MLKKFVFFYTFLFGTNVVISAALRKTKLAPLFSLKKKRRCSQLVFHQCEIPSLIRDRFYQSERDETSSPAWNKPDPAAAAEWKQAVSLTSVFLHSLSGWNATKTHAHSSSLTRPGAPHPFKELPFPHEATPPVPPHPMGAVRSPARSSWLDQICQCRPRAHTHTAQDDWQLSPASAWTHTHSHTHTPPFRSTSGGCCKKISFGACFYYLELH